MSIDGSISPIDRMIRGVEPVQARQLQQAAGAGLPADGFVKELRGALDEMIELQNEAEHMQQELAAGRITDINQVVLAVQKADLALNFALELRNKVVEAYQEVSRMQL
jgi:flagellar hook-basal body complex protein FliE